MQVSERLTSVLILIFVFDANHLVYITYNGTQKINIYSNVNNTDLPKSLDAMLTMNRSRCITRIKKNNLVSEHCERTAQSCKKNFISLILSIYIFNVLGSPVHR
jgi:hypothetical protein